MIAHKVNIIFPSYSTATSNLQDVISQVKFIITFVLQLEFEK